MEAIYAIFKNYHQISCCQHLWINFLKKFGDGGFRALFWEAARAGTVEGFEKALRKIKEKKRETYDYLVVLKPNMWSYHAMEGSANFVECFNHWMEEIRFIQPCKLLDELRSKLMDAIWSRKVIAERWNHPLTPKVNYKLRKIEEYAKSV